MTKTKCIVLGDPNQKKKPIEFVLYIDNKKTECANRVTKSYDKPGDLNYIELIKKAYNPSDYDIMYAYTSNRDDGCLYLGHWNDGVAE